MKLPESWTTVTLLSKILAILLFVMLPFGGFYLGYRYMSGQCLTTNICEEKDGGENNIVVDDKVGQSWEKPAANDRIVPVVKDNKLHWYSLTNKKLNPTEYETSWGGGESGMGEDTPQVSPDGKYIAFINRSDNYRLYILAAGSNEAIKITDYGVNHINSWSSDSSKILVYSQPNNLVISKQSDGMGETIPWETNVDFDKKTTPGFHSFDVNTGVDTFLYPLLTAEKFIDKSRVLVEMQQEDGNNRRLVLFDVDTFEADFSTVNYPIKSTNLQSTFSADGKWWARATDSGYSGGEVKIVLSMFPNDEGEVIDTGAWAFVQWPIVSPDGKYVAYLKRGEQIKEGQYAGQFADNTIVWDTATKKIIKTLKGTLKYWVDKETLLVGVSEYGSNFDSFSAFDLFNAKTQTIETIKIK